MKRLVASALVLFSTVTLWPQQPDRAIVVKAGMPPAVQEARVALVIGNSAYEGAFLKNPANDARSMKDVLETCKFQVTLLIDAGKKQMDEAISSFGQRIKGGAVGLFYYAGHGMQIQGENYLIPIGARLTEEVDIKYQGVNLGHILDRMDAAKNPLNILILDACRNNPFAPSWHRGGGAQGLASVDAPAGTVVAFATKPGSTAADGSGEHGTYTDALMARLREPGLKLDDLFNKVGAEVVERSGKQQTPWLNSSPHMDFYFRPWVVTGQPVPPGQEGSLAESEYWASVKESRDPKDFEWFLSKFPGGVYADLASRKRAALLPLAGAGPALQEPWKKLAKETFETDQEFRQRVEALPPIQVGTVTFKSEAYLMTKGMFMTRVDFSGWTDTYNHLDQCSILMDRYKAKTVAAGEPFPVVSKFTVRDGRVVAKSLDVTTPDGNFACQPECPFAGTWMARSYKVIRTKGNYYEIGSSWEGSRENSSWEGGNIILKYPEDIEGKLEGIVDFDCDFTLHNKLTGNATSDVNYFTLHIKLSNQRLLIEPVGDHYEAKTRGDLSAANIKRPSLVNTVGVLFGTRFYNEEATNPLLLINKKVSVLVMRTDKFEIIFDRIN